MDPLRGESVAHLLRELRAGLKRGDGTIALTAAQARLLVDELGRLLQSNERLRRQNRRVRRKLHGTTGEAVGEPDADGRVAGDAAPDDDVDDVTDAIDDGTDAR